MAKKKGQKKVAGGYTEQAAQSQDEPPKPDADAASKDKDGAPTNSSLADVSTKASIEPSGEKQADVGTKGAAALTDFKVGSWVQLHSLTAAHLNGCIGEVVADLNDDGRIAVRIACQGQKLLKPVNLQALADDAIPLTEVVPMKGKGMGVLARRPISKYTRILQDKPLIVIEGFANGVVANPEEFQRKFDALLPEKQKEVEALQNIGKGISGVLQTNAFSGRADSRTGGHSGGSLFIKFARVNHSCNPNAEFRWDELEEDACIYALRDIGAGEEINIAYVDVLEPTPMRNIKLARYGFRCQCMHCLDPSLDKPRQEVLEALNKEERSLAENLKCLKLIEELGLSIPIIEVLFVRGACVNHLQAGDNDEAITWGVKATDMLTKIQGPKSPLVVQLKEIVAEGAKRKKAESEKKAKS